MMICGGGQTFAQGMQQREAASAKINGEGPDRGTQKGGQQQSGAGKGGKG